VREILDAHVSDPNRIIGYGIDADDFATLRKMAARLCGGTDRERDEGNLLHVILSRTEATEVRVSDMTELLADAGTKPLAPFKCALCGQVITDGLPCGCGARPFDQPEKL
jgi:hypothetical protein